MNICSVLVIITEQIKYNNSGGVHQMLFGDKVRILRKRAGIPQKDFAQMFGITARALLYYEKNERTPREQELIDKIANFFEVSPELLTNENEQIAPTKEELFFEEAKKEDTLKGKTEARKYLERTRGMFAGGDLSEDDKDALFEVLTEIYFDAKKKAKKYGVRKNKETDMPK